MRNELAYLAGYVDGDGCFYIGKNINPIKYRSALIISSTNKEVLNYFQKTFGGGCIFGKKNPRFKTYNPINRWTIGGINGGDRQTQKFKDSYVECLRKRDIICGQIHSLNSKLTI